MDSAPEKIYRLDIAFDGTSFHGWQLQSNSVTVQETLEAKLRTLFNNPEIRVQGSSRTDSGVHALGMTASFKGPPSPYIPDWKVKKALNRLLPPSIKITDAQIAPDGFNARFSAKGKSYAYVVNTGELNPFVGRWSHHASDMRDLDAIRTALGYICGTHDFSAFTVEYDPSKDHVRTLYRAELKTFGPLVCFHIVGNGFLYKMVRTISGMLIDAGRGIIPPETLRDALSRHDRKLTRDTAPAQGLFLMKVFYEADAWKTYELTAPPFCQM